MGLGMGYRHLGLTAWPFRVVPGESFYPYKGMSGKP